MTNNTTPDQLNVLIMRWVTSSYDSLGTHLDMLATTFQSLGFNTIFLEFGDSIDLETFQKLVSENRIAFAVTMSGVAAEVGLADGTPLFDAAKIPVFSWNCDHPCHNTSTFLAKPPAKFLIDGYVFADHARFNIAHGRRTRLAIAAHLGPLPRSTLMPDGPIPLEGRNGRLIFAKGYANTDIMERNHKANLGENASLIFEAADILFHENASLLLPTLKGLMERRDLHCADDSEILFKLVAYVEYYIRNKRTALVMQALEEYPVDVFGTGWDDWAFAKNPHPGGAQWLGQMPYPAMLAALPFYLGSVSVHPMVEDSVHDRVFTAITAGVVPVSESNQFSRREFPMLEPYAFRFTTDSIRAAADALLARPEEALAATERASPIVDARFSMHQAALQMIDAVNLHNLNHL